jgi:hypothetical protein
MPKKQFLIWLAGFIDGDGSIFIGVRKQGHNKPYIGVTPSVTVTQRGDYKWVCEYIQKELGFGKVYLSNRSNAQAKATFQTTTMYDTLRLLKLLKPYLYIKKEQATKVIPVLELWIKEASVMVLRGDLRTRGATVRKQKTVLKMVKVATGLNAKMRNSTRYKGYKDFNYWKPLIKKWYPR